MLAVGLGLGPLRVGDHLQMSDDPAQSGWVQPPGRLQQDGFGVGGRGGGQVLGAVSEHAGVGGGDRSVGEGLGGGGEGAGNRARAVRTQLLAALGPRWSRLRSQLAVEGAGTTWSAPAAPRASTPASSASQWPSRRSTNRLSWRTRSARTPSDRLSTSWAANPSNSAASATSPSASPADWPADDRGDGLGDGPDDGLTGCRIECVFGFMGATYQHQTRTQPPNPKLWTAFCHRPH